ncbi:hypothetical protein N7493_011084 [Penicillium malachiteum]|uniref:DUF7605 domain-containing protein n=1 Tax=Penicillium malachiteum TaxID=1324776 RepID=A0AAD6HBH2_9EURO|nr:hypothetical protein N7493_011084 [Penicillium malachiteum]
MSVLRSEFTVTASEYNERTRSPFSFSWDRTETLAESGLQSSSVPRSPPRADQPPVFQFEGLNIANRSSPFHFRAPSIGSQSRFTKPSTFQRDESLLTPTRSTSTYSDQYNASPSPVPSHVAHRRTRQTRQSSFGSTVTHLHQNLVEPLTSEIDSDSTEMPTGSLEAVAHSERSVSVVSRESGVANRGAIREESLPSVPIHDARLQDQVKEVKSKLASLATSIGSSALVHDQSSSLYAHYQKIKKASKFEYPEIQTVGFIGDSGVGKSSLINSLLDQRGMSCSSSDGAACTCVVTEFRHTDDTHTGPYTVEAEFMTTMEITELLEELLLQFRAWFVPSARQEISSEAERKECQGAAERAWTTFRSLFKSEPGLSMGFLSDDHDGADETILREMERWAYAGLTHRPGGAQALDYSATANDVWECQKLLDLLTADLQVNDHPPLWPFVKITRVYLRSPVLRTGLVLADLPRLRDMNFARFRATERYLKYKCDEVFIVADISRVRTGDSAVSAEEATRARDGNDRRLQQMNRDPEEIEVAQEDGAQRNNSELALRESDRERTLSSEITHHLIIQRNKKVSQELLKDHAGIKVFCVSNPLYTKWRTSRTQQAEAYVNLSGILELRRYCQLALLLSLRQWILAGADSVTAERATALRGLIGKVEKALVRGTTSPQAYVARIEDELKIRYNRLINDFTRGYRGHWKNKGIETSEERASWHYSTYKVYCAHYGTYSTNKQQNRSWNDELMRPVRRQLDPQKVFTASFKTLQDNLDEEIVNITRDLHSVVTEAGQLHEAQREPELARTLEVDVEDAMGILVNAQRVMGIVVREFANRNSS